MKSIARFGPGGGGQGGGGLSRLSVLLRRLASKSLKQPWPWPGHCDGPDKHRSGTDLWRVQILVLEIFFTVHPRKHKPQIESTLLGAVTRRLGAQKPQTVDQQRNAAAKGGHTRTKGQSGLSSASHGGPRQHTAIPSEAEKYRWKKIKGHHVGGRGQRADLQLIIIKDAAIAMLL